MGVLVMGPIIRSQIQSKKASLMKTSVKLRQTERVSERKREYIHTKAGHARPLLTCIIIVDHKPNAISYQTNSNPP